MITKGTHKKEIVLNTMKDFGHFVSQSNKRTIWRKDGVQVTARYMHLFFPYWEVQAKKIS